MEYIRFFLYGLIQGLTEFIPVSSTAHLKILSNFLGLEDPGSSLSAVIQLGSVFAIIWYFRDDIVNLKKINKNFYQSLLYKKLINSIIVGTLPFLLFGAVIRFFIPYFFDSILRSNFSIAIISIFMAFLMFFADKSKNKFTDIKNHNYMDSLVIGFAQAFAIIPGVSRSGITISMALLSGWNRKDAAKYSFLLGIPAISIAAIVEFVLSFHKFSSFNYSPLLIGLFSTFISSLLAIDFLIKYLSTFGMRLFIFYRLIFGILILLNL